MYYQYFQCTSLLLLLGISPAERMVTGDVVTQTIVLDSTLTNLLGVGQLNKTIEFLNRLSSDFGNDNVTDLDKATFPTHIALWLYSAFFQLKFNLLKIEPLKLMSHSATSSLMPK